jgi:hypothetical protein
VSTRVITGSPNLSAICVVCVYVVFVCGGMEMAVCQLVGVGRQCVDVWRW